MRIARGILERFVSLDETQLTLSRLLDDLGIEVKRVHREGDETYCDLELLANRGDHRCYEGIAREVHARTGSPFHHMETKSLAGLPSVENNIYVETKRCYRYALAKFEVIKGQSQPSGGLLKVLNAAGEGSVNRIVDMANVAQIENGQPLHAYDAEKICGPVTVRESARGEVCLPLFFSEPVALPEGTVVVADDRGVLSVAGIIGCQRAAVSIETRHFLLEAACFDPVAVRIASRALAVSTSASQRFERGSDPETILFSLERAAKICEENDLAIPTALTLLQRGSKSFKRRISIKTERLAEFIGWKVDDGSIRAVLSRLGYEVQQDVDGLLLVAPSWRYWDVAEPADVYEDVLRALSYNMCPEVPPPNTQGSLATETEREKAALRRGLVAQGFFEVFTDAFYSLATRQNLVGSEEHPLWAHVEIENAVDRRYSLLRNNCLAQALEAAAHNLRFREQRFRFFEMCRTFRPAVEALTPPQEVEMLWGLMAGDIHDEPWRTTRDVDFWDAKGLLDVLGKTVQRKIELADCLDHPLTDCLHPERRSIIRAGSTAIGIVGEISPTVCRRFDMAKARLVYFEFDLHALLNAPLNPRRSRLGAARPPSKRAISFVLPARVEAMEVVDVIRSVAPPWLVEVHVTDSFDLPSPPGARSVTFELLFDNALSDKSAKDINAALEKLSGSVASRLLPKGVHQRQ